VDQIFDRFERLFKSWVSSEAESLGVRATRSRTGDADLDSAMDELDDFLDRGRTETEARERQAEADRQRREREEAARAAGGGRYGQGASASGPPSQVVAAYRTLGLSYGTPFPEVKARYKKLLMQNHPDRNSATPEQLRRSTEISAQINEAYRRIEAWTTTGQVVD